jgi:hypothetical protein
MKITEKQLSKIIKESIENVLNETNDVTFENVAKKLKELPRNFPDELDELFDYVDWSNCFGEEGDYVIVKLNGKYNYVDEFNNLISKVWFDYAQPYSNLYAVVCIYDKYNFIDAYGKILSPDKWFDYAESFDKNDLAEVHIGDKVYVINTNGNLKFIRRED